MLQPISTFPRQSRIWIYQSDIDISVSNQEQIKRLTNQFLSTWAAHGQDLKASCDIKQGHFLIIVADENFNAASGCSIDSQFRFVQGIGKEFDIDFFKRSNLAFEKNGKIIFIDMKEIKAAIESGQIHADDTFFNNNVSTIDELSEKWRVKVDESWLKRYFTNS